MREKIKLVSSAGTGHFYTTDKNKTSTPDKIEMMKFDPKIRKRVILNILIIILQAYHEHQNLKSYFSIFHNH